MRRCTGAGLTVATYLGNIIQKAHELIGNTYSRSKAVLEQFWKVFHKFTVSKIKLFYLMLLGKSKPVFILQSMNGFEYTDRVQFQQKKVNIC